MVIELVLFDDGLVIELVVELLVAAFYIPGGIRVLMAFSDGAFQLVTLAESVALLGGIGMLFGRRYDAWFAAPALVGMSGGFEDAEPEEAVPAPSTGGVGTERFRPMAHGVVAVHGEKWCIAQEMCALKKA